MDNRRSTIVSLYVFTNIEIMLVRYIVLKSVTVNICISSVVMLGAFSYPRLVMAYVAVMKL